MTSAFQMQIAAGLVEDPYECGHGWPARSGCSHCENCEQAVELEAAYSELKNAVRWMFEAMDTRHAVVSYTSDKAAARGLNGAESLGNIRENARKAVEDLL